MHVSILSEDHAEAYRAMWLHALAAHPTAFGASYDEEAAIPVEHLRVELSINLPEKRRFGAFDGERLIGIMTTVRTPRTKSTHRLYLTGMYVDADFRRQGVGHALLDAALAHARTLRGVEDVIIAVTEGNTPARNLYVSCGFEQAMHEDRYLKVDGQYYAIDWMVKRL